MTDTPDTPKTETQKPGERIAKAMARAGVASRREAERMILEGRVTVNGQKINSPALDITAEDKVRIDGKPMDEPQDTRLWLYYKPTGLVTSEADEKGRQTVFDALPRDLPRVMSVGRLDLNSEGLLLLTNDGELKRRLELPTTGWLRRYRVRVNGRPNDLTFDPLRRGATIDGEDFQPMEIRLDSQQGANAWLTVGLREGKNREIRRAMAHVGLVVNRLIRVGYGPFKLTGMEENEVREIKRRVLRDQLGGLLTGEEEEAPRERNFRARGADEGRNGDRRDDRRGDRPARGGFGRDRDDRGRGDRDRGDRDWGDRGRGDRGRGDDRRDGDRPRFGDKPRFDKPRFDRPRDDQGDAPRKPRHRRDDAARDGDRKPFGDKRRDDKSFGDRRDGDRPRRDGDRKPYGGKPFGDKRRDDKSFGDRRDGDRPRRDGERKPYGGKPFGDKRRDDKSFGDRRDGDRPRRDGDRKPYGSKPFGDKNGERSGGFKSHKERGDRQAFGKRSNEEGKSRAQHSGRSGMDKPVGRGAGYGPARRESGGGQPDRKGGFRNDKPRGDKPQGGPRKPRNPKS